jgi:hypothetical protein
MGLLAFRDGSLPLRSLSKKKRFLGEESAAGKYRNKGFDICCLESLSPQSFSIVKEIYL